MLATPPSCSTRTAVLPEDSIVACRRLPGFRSANAQVLAVRAGLEGAQPAVLLRFDGADFDSDAFDAWGIACPAAVARSVRKRQAEFFFGRLAARLALELLGHHSVEVRVGGSGEPIWPISLVGSISHTGALAVAWVLESRAVQSVGIDVERIVSTEVRQAIAQVAVNKSEAAYLCALGSACPHLSTNAAFTLAYSAKESFFKAAFGTVGRYFDFSAARVSHVDTERRHLVLTLTETLGANLVAGRTFVLNYVSVDDTTIMTSIAW